MNYNTATPDEVLAWQAKNPAAHDELERRKAVRRHHRMKLKFKEHIDYAENETPEFLEHLMSDIYPDYDELSEGEYDVETGLHSGKYGSASKEIHDKGYLHGSTGKEPDYILGQKSMKYHKDYMRGYKMGKNSQHEDTQPIKMHVNPITRIQRAFDHIGNGNNPHTGEPLPAHGSKAYKEVIKAAHERLKAAHGVNPKGLLAGNKKLQDSSGAHIKDKEGRQIFSQGLSLSPAHKINGINTCPKASTECKKHCLAHTSGAMARTKHVADAKKRKTEALFNSPEDTALALHHHITNEKKLAAKSKGKDDHYGYSVRMNTTSDIPQKAYHGLRKAHPDVQFYDYTKEHKQVLDNLERKKKGEEGHKNLHLTFSSTGVGHSESNWHHARKVLDAGGNVAAVSTAINAKKGKELKHNHILPKQVHDKETGKHYPTLDGDGRSPDLDGHGDARFLDKPGHVAMLHLKGVNPNQAKQFAIPHDKNTRIAHV